MPTMTDYGERVYYVIQLCDFRNEDRTAIRQLAYAAIGCDFDRIGIPECPIAFRFNTLNNAAAFVVKMKDRFADVTNTAYLIAGTHTIILDASRLYAGDCIAVDESDELAYYVMQISHLNDYRVVHELAKQYRGWPFECESEPCIALPRCSARSAVMYEFNTADEVVNFSARLSEYARNVYTTTYLMVGSEGFILDKDQLL